MFSVGRNKVANTIFSVATPNPGRGIRLQHRQTGRFGSKRSLKGHEVQFDTPSSEQRSGPFQKGLATRPWVSKTRGLLSGFIP